MPLFSMMRGAWLAFWILAAPVTAQAQTALAVGGAASSVNRPLMDAVSGDRADVVSTFAPGGALVIFWGNQCVWSQRYEERLQQAIRQGRQDGLSILLVNANDPQAFPKEDQSESAQVGRRLGVDRYFLDPDGSLARAMGAQRIPHVFLFDRQQRLAYAGAIDDSPGDAALVQERYLINALQALRGGQAPDPAETQPFGCRIKL